MEVGGGDGVFAGVEGAAGHLLGGLEDEAGVGLGDGPGAGRVDAGTVSDGGQGAVAGGHLAALDTRSLVHGVGLHEVEGVTAREKENVRQLSP